MRAIITALFLILFSQSAGAMTNQDLYKYCKSYTDAGFDISKMEYFEDALICTSYFNAIGHMIGEACNAYDINYELAGIKPDFKQENLAATIQYYVNYMSEKPEYWKYVPSLHVATSSLKISGQCPN